MRNILVFAMVVLFGTTVFAQWNYPTTKKIKVSDTYFGVTYNDNYRWLEDMKNPEVASWFKQQADLTDATMNTISGRDELIAEWRKLDKLQPASYGNMTKEGGRIFFQKRMPGEKVSKVYYRENMDSPEILLFDPLTFIDGKTLSVGDAIPSYDGKKLIISYSENGAEVSTIQVMDVDTKKFLPDLIPATAGAMGWTFDNSAFMYMWIKSADNNDPEGRLNPKTKLHTLGTDSDTDSDFFSNETYPNLNIESKSYPYVYLSKHAKDYVFAGEGTVQNEMTLFYAPISQFDSGEIAWKTLSKTTDKLVGGLDVFDDKIYAITYKDADNYKLVSTDLKNPNWDNATVVVPEKTMILKSSIRCKDYFLLRYSDGINSHLYKYNPKNNTTSKVELPFIGTVYFRSLDSKSNEYLVGVTSWNKPFTEFLFNAETEKFKASPFNKPSVYPAEYNDLVVEEVEVKGHDGVMIPLSIIYKKGTKKEGSNVCFMDSYGAYGYSMTPYFSDRYASLAVKNVVIAVPHVRGGSEKGEAWYKAGFKTTKPNTWKDFISCAEYLIDQGFTQSSKLSGMGTSAGGILISRAITERPDLFAAAICNVGCANAMRLEFSSNGPVNIPEFGTVNDNIESKALYEMDGMQHVKEGVEYPAVICIAGWTDPRVAAWQPGKFAAAVQNASASDKPVLMKVNYDNGHFTEDREVTWANFADQLAFAMWQSGHPDFQPKG
ncbi:S9 family peptidase [Bizionia saleffrena]|uniref:prolyl oligopeptidase n=1 Tax=Bizionia saleffrena TaxID=291189 RepID=A0A8H2LFX6_9FLAO|nr:prolyl oligopeptidase family serine peptidase [Bizionia saleffrena]TYB80355.1 S9 family peptidase [Bizionia saleffrena]